MQRYDLPTIYTQSMPSDTVCRRPVKKRRALDFLLWQSATLVLLASVLTCLRYFELLTPLVESVRGFLGI